MNFFNLCQHVVVAAAATEKTGIWQHILGWIQTLIAWLYDLTAAIGLPSWLLAVFIFTLVIKIVLQPLTNKQMRSMRRMQLLQPQVNELKKRYATNPQKLNQETMKLYKKHNASPTAGCLPLLLQMPILIALYQALRTYTPADIAGFGSPLLGIDNLSTLVSALPNGMGWLLPVAAGGATFLQQYVSTANKQDKQQRMMMIMMPLMFVWFVRQFPALLAFYWIFYSLIGAAIFYVMMRKWSKEDKQRLEEEEAEREAEAEAKRQKKAAAREVAKKKPQQKSAAPTYAVEASDFADEPDDDEDEEIDEDPEAAFRTWLKKQGISVKQKKMRLHPYSTEDDVVEIPVLPGGKEGSMSQLRQQYQREVQQQMVSSQMEGTPLGKLMSWGKKRRANAAGGEKKPEPARVKPEETSGAPGDQAEASPAPEEKNPEGGGNKED